MSCTGCSTKYHDFYSPNIYNWCTNCGNYGIAAALKRSLVETELGVKDALLCYDIGCNGNGADKINAYTFHGLHGRILPFAAGAALANSKIKVIASAGDGATFSEGINHLIHSIRNNYNITFLLHNNGTYALTTGQAAATTKQDMSRTAAPDGVTAETINPLLFALNQNVGFAARTFSGNIKQMTAIFAEAIRYPGFSFVEILQNCPTYNKENSHEWYQSRVYDTLFLDSYNNSDLEQAKAVAADTENKIATGIIYKTNKPTFLERQANRATAKTELVDEVEAFDISGLLAQFS